MSNPFAHPTPTEAYELGTKHAALLRELFNHPGIKYSQPPTAQICDIDAENTHPGLFWVIDFVQNTYVDRVIPFLPAGATRRCRALANPWAYADDNYTWELEWDGEGGELRNVATGEALAFPQLPASQAKGKMSDIFSRGMITKKLVLENQTDAMARMMMGGRSVDFGEVIETIIKDLY